ncbi:uncharacterized protein LOC142231387 [Haematobia irritans]|uniref:uncharacterized protein LOC142231387 n=1 Tax=Haematobia irritans TaxID=7368 RepID=UPI003F4FB1CF
MYADDVQLYASCDITFLNDYVAKISDDLSSIHRWAKGNGLSLNPKKSKMILIRKRSLNVGEFNLFLAGERIESVNKAKNLGIIFNEFLDWTDHISVVCGKIYGLLRNLWATFTFTPFNIRMLLAKSYLIPTLLYGCEIFAGCNTQDFKKLKTTFNSITRYVFGLKRFDRVSPYNSQVLKMPFDKYLIFRTVTFLHKIIVTMEPTHIYNHLTFCRSNRGRNICQIPHRSMISERQFIIRAIRLWNQVPNDIQTIHNTGKFKRHLLTKMILVQSYKTYVLMY